jgi:hypothetical protein
LRNVITIDTDIKHKKIMNAPLVTQNDSVSFIINVLDDGQPFSLDSVTTVSLANLRLDRVTVVTPGTKIEENTVKFDLGTEETKVPGKVEATVQLYDADERVSTISFAYQVVKDPTGDGYIPTANEQTLIETVLNDGPLVIQQAQDAADYATAQGDYAKQVADENKTRWLNPVATYTDIATTYPSPNHGDTVMTLDDGKIYRYDSGAWKFTQQYNSTALNNLANELSKQNKQSVTLTHGLNIINASQNSPLDVRIEGRTLVNLLGIQGRTATSATVTLDSAKYYVLVNEDGTSVTVDGVLRTVPYKFTGKSSVSLSWTSGKVALYEVDTTEYNNILTTWTASEVNRRYPYVDSVQHVQNPYVIAEGENLLDSTYVRYSSLTVLNEKPYEATIDWTAGMSFYLADGLPVLKNQNYTFSYDKEIFSNDISFIIHGENESVILANGTANKVITFNTGNNSKIIIKGFRTNATFGKVRVFNWMLTLGSETKPFVPRNPSTLFAEAKLGSLADKKDILFKDGQDWKVRKEIEKDVVLDGSISYGSVSNFTGFKRLNFTPTNPININYFLNIQAIKYDGKPLENDNTNTTFDTIYGHSSGAIYFTVSNTDSGWGENYTPSSSEIKAYFYGWRMCNGTYGQPYDDTGTKTWYPIGDTDLSRAVTTCPTSAAPTITEGKISYYKLSYVRSTPVTEVVTDKVEGDLVVNGATQIECGSGVIVREKANPVLLLNNYYINGQTTPDSKLKYRVDKFVRVYKNGVTDPKWRVENHAGMNIDKYGKNLLGISQADFDPTAEYTVTYLVLDRHLFTTNILSVIANYDSSLKSVVDDMVAKQSDIAATVSVNVRAIAELYKRVKALGG